MASEPPPPPPFQISQAELNIQAGSTKKTYSAIVQKNLLQPMNINSPVSPRTVKKTFQNTNIQDEPNLMSALPSETYHNHPAALLYVEEVAVLAEKLKWQLVGKFNRMPEWEKIKSHFQKMQLSGAYSVQWFNYRNIFIKLSNEFDYAKVRRKPIFDFDANHRMRILKWDTKFSPDKESPVVPVWITFPSLPNHLYNEDTLKILASTLGNPLQMDDPTANGTRPSHPRICIEFDCLKSPPGQIFVHLRSKETGLNEDGFWQKVILEKIPSYCTHCLHLGHALADCRIFPIHQKNKGKSEATINLTENWMIGNRKSDKTESHLHNVPLKIVTSNSFATLDKEKTNPVNESQKVSELQTCAINCEASVPGSSTFEVSESALPQFVKNPPLEDKPLLNPVEKDSNHGGSNPESSKRACDQEDFVVVEDGSEDDNTRLPEAGNLPEKVEYSDKGTLLCVTSNQASPMSEKGQQVGGVSVIPVGGVAQETTSSADRVCATQPSVEVQLRDRIAGEEVAMGPIIEGGPSPNIVTDARPGLVSEHHSSGPKAQSLPKVAVDVQPMTFPSSQKPEGPGINGLDPNAQNQKGHGVCSGESQTDSDVVDHWVLSERRADRRNSKLNREAASFFPTMGLHNPSWIEDGEDDGPVFPHVKRNNGPQGDDLSDIDAESDASFFSEYREIDEEFEDDFTVHPPRKWNSTNNLQQMQPSPRLTPPVTRSKGIKLGKGKNKLRW